MNLTMRRLIGCFLALAAFDCIQPTRCAHATSDRPLNVVFILADDLGWSDVTLYGTTKFYQTPNIERLAARGMTFTRAYSASPLCSPTRASILTGLSPARHGITSPGCHTPKVLLEAQPGTTAGPQHKSVAVESVTRLVTRHDTLPKSLKAQGYATGHFGKWHLGAEPYSPIEHGFDVDIPHHPGPGPAGSYVAPWRFNDFDHDPDEPNQHIEDRMAKEAVTWMEEHQDEPFFLNYWMFSVHAPFDAKQKLIEKHGRRVDPKDPQRSPTYAAMIESMDDAVGVLLDALDRLEIAEHTVIIFASDNGGNMYNQVDGTTPTSNAPLRGGKATMFEGGVRSPCVVVWPKIVEPNSRSDEIIQSCDYYPTLLDILEIPRKRTRSFDGISIVPALTGGTLDREAIFTYFPHSPPVPDWLPPSVSVHHGDWKLIRIFYGGENGAHDYRLYNLQDDIGEASDLSSQHPEKVIQLDRLIEQHLIDTSAVCPTPNPNFDLAKYDPQQIGIPARRNAGGTANVRRQPVPKPVVGWIPNKHCELKSEYSSLAIQSTGNDPHISRRLPGAIPQGTYQLEIEATSNGSGRGQFFWEEQSVSPRFHRDRSVLFAMKHGVDRPKYVVPFAPKSDVISIRWDPGQGPGVIDLHSIRIKDQAGNSVWEWNPPRGE